MHQAFWLERWQQSQIGFHCEEINPHLQRFWPILNVAPGSPVFVPLCGKSNDMLWLLAQGYEVIGVELSPLAVDAFFYENGLVAVTRRSGKFNISEAEGLRIYCGDFFDLNADDLGGVCSVYDRASLVALPPDMRKDYGAHMRDLLKAGTKTLLVAFDYPQQEMPGPPFSVQMPEVQALYGSWCGVELLCTEDILDSEPRFLERGVTSMKEQIYALVAG